MFELVIFSKFHLDHLNLDLAPTQWFYVTLINNYWMGLSMISRIIQTKVNVICRSRTSEADNVDRGLDNSC